MPNPRVSLFEELFELPSHNTLTFGYLNGNMIAYQSDAEDEETLNSKPEEYALKESKVDPKKFASVMSEVFDVDITVKRKKMYLGGQELYSFALYLPSCLMGVKLSEDETPVGISIAHVVSDYLRNGLTLIESTKEE